LTDERDLTCARRVGVERLTVGMGWVVDSRDMVMHVERTDL